MVLSSWQSHCDSSPGSFDECRMAPSGRRPKTKPDDLGCESACTGCQKLHPPSPYIIITQYSARKLILIHNMCVYTLLCIDTYYTVILVGYMDVL